MTVTLTDLLRGDPRTTIVVVQDGDGQPIDLSDSDWACQWRATPAGPLVATSAVDVSQAGDGILVVPLTGEHSRAMSEGVVYGEVEGSEFATLTRLRLTVRNDVTRVLDGDEIVEPTGGVTETIVLTWNGELSTVVEQAIAAVFPAAAEFDGVHNDIDGRDAADAHPLASITGLGAALAAKADSSSLGSAAAADVGDFDPAGSAAAAIVAHRAEADGTAHPGIDGRLDTLETNAASFVSEGDDADVLGSGDASDGQVLTADGAGVAAWEDAAAGGGGVPIDATGLAEGDDIITADNAVIEESEDGTFRVVSTAAAQTPLIVRGAASQTADLQEWQNSAGVTRTAIAVDGAARFFHTTGAEHGRIYSAGDHFVIQPMHGGGTGRLVSQSGALQLRWSNTGLGFFGTAPVARPTGVAVTEAAIHAALVSLGLITA